MKTPPAITLQDAFALGEASMQLEGFHPEQNAMYAAAKARILAGELTFDEAVKEGIAKYDRNTERSAA